MVDWSVENMNPDMTPHGMSLYVYSVSPKKETKIYHKHLILIRLQ